MLDVIEAKVAQYRRSLLGEADKEARLKGAVARRDLETVVELMGFSADTPIWWSDSYDGLRSYQIVWGSGSVPVVFMRGSKRVLCRLHALSHHLSDNGWRILVLERYFRMKRITAFTPEEVDGVLRPLNYPVTGHASGQQWAALGVAEPTPGYRAMIWFRGKRIAVTLWQYEFLRKTSELIQKVVCVEDRLEALREWRKAA